MTCELAHEYVHYMSVGNLEKCRKIIQDTKHQLKQLYNERNIGGYQLLLIKNKIDVAEKLIEPKFQGVTQGKFPFVYSLVQPLENSQVDFDTLMEDLHYKRVDSFQGIN